MHCSRFWIWERSFWHCTTTPVGRCVIRTAESVFIAGLFVYAAPDYIAMSEKRGLKDEAKAARDAMNKMIETTLKHGYDGDWFRQALAARKIAACIPSKANRKIAIPHDPVLYRQRHHIENMFGKLKDWRRIHTRYDRCAHTFMSAICIAATIIFWLTPQ